jgi:Flp pilus assembly pilin Flp
MIRSLYLDLRDDERGQSTVEYMLLISVIVIAIVAAAYVFVPEFEAGVKDLGKDVKKILSTGKIGSKVGTTR